MAVSTPAGDGHAGAAASAGLVAALPAQVFSARIESCIALARFGDSGGRRSAACPWRADENLRL